MQNNKTRGPGQAAFIFIFVTVVLDMMAVGIIAPVLPKLVIEFEQGDIARAAGYVGLFATLWAAMQFIFAPMWAKSKLSSQFLMHCQTSTIVDIALNLSGQDTDAALLLTLEKSIPVGALQTAPAVVNKTGAL